MSDFGPLRIPALTLCILAAAQPAAHAQAPTDTLPSGYLSREGDARHWVPVQFAPSRAQSTWDPSVITFPTGNLTRLYLRPDVAQSTTPMIAHNVAMTIHMSSVGVTMPGHIVGTSYAANRGSDRVRVLNSTNVNFPAFTIPSSGPSPWTVSIPIQNFPYQSGNPLQIEWDVATPTSGPASWNWFCDAKRWDPSGSSGFFVRDDERHACPSSGTAYAGEVGGPGELCSIWFNSLAGNSRPAVLFIGLSDHAWASQPLPIDLTAYGFPGCRLWTDPTVGIPAFTDASGVLGRVGVDIPLPFHASLAG